MDLLDDRICDEYYDFLLFSPTGKALMVHESTKCDWHCVPSAVEARAESTYKVMCTGLIALSGGELAL